MYGILVGTYTAKNLKNQNSNKSVSNKVYKQGVWTCLVHFPEYYRTTYYVIDNNNTIDSDVFKRKKLCATTHLHRYG